MNFYHLDAAQYVVPPFWANGQSPITNHVFPLRPLRPLREALCLSCGCRFAALGRKAFYLTSGATTATSGQDSSGNRYPSDLCNLNDLIKLPPNSQKSGCW
jgi:hypothetical protein